MAMEMAFGVGFLTVLSAAIASWVFGGIYYGALGKYWIVAAELNRGKMESTKGFSKAQPFVIGFASEFIMAYVFSTLLFHTSDGAFSIGAAVAAAVYLWNGFIATSIVTNNAFGMRKFSLSGIDGVHWLGVLVVQALVISLLAAG
jgi:hypothetical protein